MARTLYEHRPGCYRNSSVPYALLNQRTNEYFEVIDGCLCHRSPLKLLINPILRMIQFWTDTPYVIASEYETCPVNGYYFIRYRFMRVKQLKRNSLTNGVTDNSKPSCG